MKWKSNCWKFLVFFPETILLMVRMSVAVGMSHLAL